MRIVVLGGYAPSLIRFRAPLLEAMVRRGHRVTTIAAGGSVAIREDLGRLGVEFEELRLERAGIDPLRDLRTIATLTARLRALRPEVLLTYTVKPNIYGGLAGYMARVPRRFAMVTGLGYAFLGQDRLRRRVFARFVRELYRAGFRGLDGVFFQNRDDRDVFDTLNLLSRSTRRIMVNGSGVDLDWFRPGAPPPGPPSFLFVGRLLVEKGFRDFAEAARLVRSRRPQIPFRALGWLDPNPTSVTAEEVADWTREQVFEFLGDSDDVRPVLARHHVLVLPSYREGTPRSVLEALAMARPAIVTDAPGCRETVSDGDNGFLVPVRDPAAIAAACERFIADPGLVERMGARGRQIVEDRFDARVVADGMLEAMGL